MPSELSRSRKALGLVAHDLKACFAKGRLDEQHLNSVKRCAEGKCEIPVNSIAGKRCPDSLCSLFSIYVQLPKLNVAGSIPVSRSIESTSYGK